MKIASIGAYNTSFRGISEKAQAKLDAGVYDMSKVSKNSFETVKNCTFLDLVDKTEVLPGYHGQRLVLADKEGNEVKYLNFVDAVESADSVGRTFYGMAEEIEDIEHRVATNSGMTYMSALYY